MRTTLRRHRVIAAHRVEGEPQTMARVQGMCEERWPGRSSVAWITPSEPRRHVAVTFPLRSRTRVEGAAATWLEAMDAVDAESALLLQALRADKERLS